MTRRAAEKKERAGRPAADGARAHRRARDVLLAAVLALLAMLGQSIARADVGPFLQIDTGGHTNTIRDVAFSRDGTRIYSAGYDKVVRVWDLASDATTATLRGQITDRQTGDIYAMALSPDDRTLAVGGYMEAPCDGDTCGANGDGSVHYGDIRLFDTRSGAVLALLEARANITLSLSFSSDGRLLASSHAPIGTSEPDRQTIRIWNVPERRLMTSFASNPNGKAGSIKAAISPDGTSVAVVAVTTTVEVFSIADRTATPRLLEDVGTLAPDEHFSAVAFAADGQSIAAATDKGTLLVWSWPDGRLKAVVAGNGATVAALAFGHAATAQTVVTTPGRATPDHRYVVRIIDIPSGAVREFAAHDDNVAFALAFSPDGTRVATAGGNDKAIHVWPALAPAPSQKLVGHGRTVMAVGFLTDTVTKRESLAWGYVDPCPGEPSCPDRNGPLQFAMTLPTLAGGAQGTPRPIDTSRDAKGTGAGDSGAIVPGAGVSGLGTSGTVVHQAETTAAPGRLTRQRKAATQDFPTLMLEAGDKSVLLSTRDADEGSNHRAYSFDPTRRNVASGGNDGVLAILGLDGAKLRDMSHTSGDIYALAYSRDGRLLATGSNDQTVRLWNPQTGKLVVSLLHTNDGEWAMWTPQGYFSASQGGEKLVGWQVNHGRDKAGVRITGNEVREHFFRPQLVERAIALASAEEAVEEARKDGSISDFTLDNLQQQLPPKFKIIDPQRGKRTNDRQIGISIAWPAARPPIDKFDVFVNGDRIAERDYTATAFKTGEQTGLRFATLRLKPGRNDIRIAAYAGKLRAEDDVQVIYQGPPGVEERDTLYVVAIGINKYPHLVNCPGIGDGTCDLRYADRDARELARTLEARMVGQGKGHARIEHLVLYSGAGGANEPTRENIEKAMKLFAKARSNDTSVLFVAGHGDNNRGYQFLTADARATDGVWDPGTVLAWHDLQGALASASGRRVMFVDTCRAVRDEANSAYDRSIINNGKAQEIAVFTSTSPDQEALEIDSVQHGAFTAELIKGIDGAADLVRGRRITLGLLYSYLQHFVGELTASERDGFRQAPQYFIPSSLNDFVLVYLGPPAAQPVSPRPTAAR